MMKSLVEILNDYFENTPKDIQDKDWERLKVFNTFGPEVSTYVERVLNAFYHENVKIYIKDYENSYNSYYNYYLAA